PATTSVGNPGACSSSARASSSAASVNTRGSCTSPSPAPRLTTGSARATSTAPGSTSTRTSASGGQHDKLQQNHSAYQALGRGVVHPRDPPHGAPALEKGRACLPASHREA